MGTRTDILMNVIELARLGTEKKILTSYFSHNFSMISAEFQQARNEIVKQGITMFSKGTGWYRKSIPDKEELKIAFDTNSPVDIPGAVVADRVLRLYLGLFPDRRKSMPFELSAGQLLVLYQKYIAVYQNDDISTTRMFYLFANLREKSALTDKCECCNKPYVFHADDLRSQCGTCDTLRSIKNHKIIHRKTA